MPLRNLGILFIAGLASIICYERAARNRYLDTLAQAMNIVREDYVDEVEPRLLFEGAMDGMMNQLDMYSSYSPPQEYSQFKEQMDGEFPGIGVMIEQDEKTKDIVVLVPMPGSPAAKAGLKSGDHIVAIEGVPTAGIPLEDSIAKIKGPAGSKVTLSVRHASGEKPVDIQVARATIAVESVLGDARREDGTWIFRVLAEPRIGYVRLVNFTERTEQDLKGVFDSYRQPGEGIDALVIDLRGNEGGLLKAAVATCDLLLDDGLIVSTRGRGGALRESYEAKPGVDLDPQIPIAILIDRQSASASEIVAACLQDHGRAVVVGQRSWGKGTVQNLIEMEGGRTGALRLTIASYWRPSGKDIHKRRTSQDADEWGVRPDAGMDVPLTSDQYLTWAKARRKRDITPLAELEAELKRPPEAPPADSDKSLPDPQPLAPDIDTEPLPPMPQPDASEDEALAPALFVDPPLERAIEVLRQQMDERPGGPKPA
jgi:carboxyl-terminal processing protease